MIVPVEVDRDARGYWTHPALIRSCCQTTPQLMWWLRVQKLECFVMSMRDEATEAFCAGWDDGPPDASAWELVPPPGKGWFLVQYIHGRRAGVLLVPSYHKSLTPPQGVVVQRRRRGKPVSPPPAFLIQ
jgi:hypothetical protein